MPKVAQYQSDPVRTELVKQRPPPVAPASAFRDLAFESALKLAEIGISVKQRVDTTSAEEASVNLERDMNDSFSNPDGGYLNTQGYDAYNNATAARKTLDDLKIKHGETLNSSAKEMFDRVADRLITRGQSDIDRHSSKGLKIWEISTIESQVENSIENASLHYDNPERLKIQSINGKRAIADSLKLQGLYYDENGKVSEIATERIETFESTFAKASIEAATQSSSIEGKTALEEYGDKLEGPDKVKIDQLIEKKAKIEKTQMDANAAVLTATKLVDQYDKRGDVIAEINKIEDPDLRKKTMTESMSQFSRKKQAESESANKHYQNAIKLVNEGLTATEIELKDSEAWLGMTDKQRNNIMSGKHMITDQILLNKLRSLPVKDKANLNAADYAADLKPSDLKRLTTEINAAKKGKQGSRVKSLSSKSMQAAEGAFGKKSKWTTGRGKQTEKGEQANEFLNDLQEAIDESEDDKQRRLTPAEENEIISEFTRGIVVQRSAFGFDILAADVEIDLSNTPAEDVRILNRIINDTPNIDVKDLTEAYQFLIDNNQPITVDSLSNAYKQGTQ